MMKLTKMYLWDLWYVEKVVDARAGPGMKSMTKFKSKNKKATEKDNTCEKIEKIMKKKKRKLEREASPALSDRSESKEDIEMTEVDFLTERGTSGSGGSSRTASPGGSDCEDNAPVSVSRRHKAQAKRRETLPEVSGFVHPDFWKPEKVCCGTIFKGPNGEVLIDPRFLKPCEARLANSCKSFDSPIDEKTSVDSNNSKTDSDSSSDSGYDESSNPGAEKDSSAFKKDEFLIKSELSISPMQVGN